MESGYASTSVPQATSLAATTGSFQNQPSLSAPSVEPPRTSRKRGALSLLQDSNIEPVKPQARRACLQAKENISSQSSHYAARGNPTKGAKVRFQTPASTCTSEYEPQVGLKDIMHDTATINKITGNLLAYVKRNVPFEVQKAIAITIMTTAIAKWGSCIVDAASHAADCMGFNEESVRIWACALIDTPLSPDDNLDDARVTEMLSSDRGHYDHYVDSLVNDEAFQLEARSFVRKHACRKGEPNLTSADFSAWIQAKYNTTIHDSTARRWLEKLGFERVHHQKGVYFDGHDRDDVVLYRNEFLIKLADFDKKSLTYDGVVP